MKRLAVLLVTVIAVALMALAPAAQAQVAPMPYGPTCQYWNWSGNVPLYGEITGPFNYWYKLTYSRGSAPEGGDSIVGFSPNGQSDLRDGPVTNLVVYAANGGGDYQQAYAENDGPVGPIYFSLHAATC